MTLATDISKITEETLRRMDVFDFAWVKLVKGTFAAETLLQELNDEANDSAGMMMMSRDYFKDVVRSALGPDKRLQAKVYAATGVDVSKHELPVLFWYLQTNVAFQVAITYVAYKSNYLLSPNDNFEDLASNYARFWLDSADDKDAIETFKTAYKQVYHA